MVCHVQERVLWRVLLLGGKAPVVEEEQAQDGCCVRQLRHRLRPSNHFVSVFTEKITA